MIIDYSSRPPTPAFAKSSAHLDNYRRVYGASEGRAKREDAANSLEGYLAGYEALDARAVVIKARDLGTTFGFRIANEDVAAFCQAHGPRYIGFAGVDPYRGQAAVDELQHAVRDLGLRGLNIQGFELKLRINDPILYPLYEKAIELGIPVNIHCGMNFSTATAMSYGRPEHLDELLVDLPELRVCASPPGWPWVNELIAAAWRHPNLWIGIAAVRPRYLAKANSGYEPLLQYGKGPLKHRMIFASSFPMLSVEDAVADVAALPLPDETRRLWLHDNAAAFLGLDPAP